MVCHIQGGTQAEGVREQGAEEYIWAQEERCDRDVDKATKTRTWLFVLVTKYYSGDQIEKIAMDGACSMYEGPDRCIHECGRETWGKETTWKTQA